MAISTTDFAKKVKQKYPQYANVPDEVLTQAIIKKYPTYGGMVDTGNMGAGGQNTQGQDQPQQNAAETNQTHDRNAILDFIDNANNPITKFGGVLSKVGNFLYGNTAKTVVPIIGRGVESGAKLVGKDIGNTFTKEADKNLTVKNAALSAMEVLPVEKALGLVGKGVKYVAPGAAKAVEEILPKTASWLTNTSKVYFDEAIKMGASKLKSAGKIVSEESNFPEIGKQIYSSAKDLVEIAQKTWQKDEGKIIAKLQNNIGKSSELAKKGVKDQLKIEGIRMKKDGSLDFAESSFMENSVAKVAIQKVARIVSAPIKEAKTLIRKQTAIADVIDSIPLEEKNARRIIGELKQTFDSHVNTLTDNAAGMMRKQYAQKVGPAREIMDALTDADGKFSPDAASRFIKQSMDVTKFNKQELLQTLDKQVGSQFAEEVRAMGLAKALNKLDPPTAGRVKDVIVTYGITKIPVVSALVSPKFWSSMLVKEKAAQSSILKLQDVSKYLVQQMIKNIIDVATPEKK